MSPLGKLVKQFFGDDSKPSDKSNDKVKKFLQTYDEQVREANSLQAEDERIADEIRRMEQDKD